MKRVSVWMLSVVLFTFALPALGEGEGFKLHPELKRSDVWTLLPGTSIHTDNASSSYTFARDTLKYTASMGVVGSGSWRLDGDHGIWAEITAKGGFGNNEPTTSTVKWSDFWDTGTGLISFKDQHGQRVSLDCDGNECGQEVTMIKLVPGSKDMSLFDALVKGYHDGGLVKGKPAKNPRTVSEIWWVSQHGKSSARRLSKKFAPIIGNVEVKQWTWGGPPYDLIVVVGEKKK